MTHSLTANFSTCDFNTAAVTDHALITDGLEFTAEAFPLLCGTDFSLLRMTMQESAEEMPI